MRLEVSDRGIEAEPEGYVNAQYDREDSNELHVTSLEVGSRATLASADAIPLHVRGWQRSFRAARSDRARGGGGGTRGRVRGSAVDGPSRRGARVSRLRRRIG